MRSLPSGINTAIGTAGSYPGYLIYIVPTAGDPLPYTTLDANFTTSGGTFTWYAIDCEDPSLIWDGGVMRPAQLTFGDYDGTFWAAAVAGYFADAPVTIWQVYAGAANEAEALWSGWIGAIKRAGAVSGEPTVTFDLTNGSDTNSSPRTRIQEIIDEQYLLAAGTILQFETGGQITVLPPSRSAAG